MKEKFGYDKHILIEEFLTGKDLSVRVVGIYPGDYMVLPIIEEDYPTLTLEPPRICGYNAKRLLESPYWNIISIPANIPNEAERFIVEPSLKLFESLKLEITTVLIGDLIQSGIQNSSE